MHYAHVIPDNWGPYVDIHATWSKFARIYPWISVHEPAKAISGKTEDFPLWEDENVLVVIWMGGVPVIRNMNSRKAKASLVYAEAIGDADKMLPAHLEEIQKFRSACVNGQYELVFVHTPWMKEQMEAVGLRAAVLPLGWDESIYGAPRFEGPKLYDYVYYGSSVGKRLLTMPFLQEQLGTKLHDISGCFGRLVTAELDRSRASLYIAHSDVRSYSTWRIWQTLGTSACLVSEPGDSWPLDPERHMVLLDTISWVNVEQKPKHLLKILDEVDLLSIAKLAHEEVAKHYTCERCIDEYLVPAGAAICGR